MIKEEYLQSINNDELVFELLYDLNKKETDKFRQELKEKDYHLSTLQRFQKQTKVDRVQKKKCKQPK